jgi:uncharacterized protein (TIGR03000 family)
MEDVMLYRSLSVVLAASAAASFAGHSAFGDGKHQTGQDPQEDRATIVVTLPEDAKLTFDDEPSVSTGSNRLFVTPPLERGKVFHYTLKAEVIRNGKTKGASEQITVRAGEETRVDLLPAQDRRIAVAGDIDIALAFPLPTYRISYHWSVRKRGAGSN